MGRHQEKLAFLDAQPTQDATAVNLGLVVFQDFEDRVAGDKYSCSVDSFLQQVEPTILHIGKQP